MKNFPKGILLLLGVLSFSLLFAQHGRYNRRYYNTYRHYNTYAYHYRPYSYAPVRASVSLVARLPFGAVAVTLGSRHYHYYDGIFYEPLYGGYALIEPPIGIIVPVLPPNAVFVIIGGRPYYRFQSSYYMPLGDNRYEVVPQPQDEESQSPGVKNNNSGSEDYEKVILDGRTYYKKGDKYYKANVNDNGEIIYEEAGEASK